MDRCFAGFDLDEVWGIISKQVGGIVCNHTNSKAVLQIRAALHRFVLILVIHIDFFFLTAVKL